VEKRLLQRSRHGRSRFVQLIPCLAAALLGGCAGVQTDASLPTNDPNEQTNRAIFAANQLCSIPWRK
jgi:hypothetical protein